VCSYTDIKHKHRHVVEERKGKSFSLIFGGSYDADSNIVCCVEMVVGFEVICLFVWFLLGISPASD
jgi:hypothetical protein